MVRVCMDQRWITGTARLCAEMCIVHYVCGLLVSCDRCWNNCVCCTVCGNLGCKCLPNHDCSYICMLVCVGTWNCSTQRGHLYHGIASDTGFGQMHDINSWTWLIAWCSLPRFDYLSFVPTHIHRFASGYFFCCVVAFVVWATASIVSQSVSITYALVSQSDGRWLQTDAPWKNYLPHGRSAHSVVTH